MCLHEITKDQESVPDEEGPEYGWKVFVDHPGFKTLSGPYYQSPSLAESRIAEIDPDFSEHITANNGTYAAGFHIYLKYDDAVALAKWLHEIQAVNAAPWARHLVIRRVSYWGKVVYGRACGAPAVVAYNMLIHPHEDRSVATPRSWRKVYSSVHAGDRTLQWGLTTPDS